MAGEIIWKGPTNALVELKDSGVLTLADRSTLLKRYAGLKSLTDLSVLARGTYGTGLMAGWVVTSSKSEPHPDGKGIGILTINWEAGGMSATMPLPSGEFSADPIELYPRVERNAIFNGDPPISVQSLTDAYAAIHGATPKARADALAAINASTDPTQKQLALLLVGKLTKGDETYYEAGFRVTVTSFSYAAPSITRGGFRDIAPTPPGESWNGAIGWLRLADALQSAGVNGSMWKTTRTWLGGPNGYWDTDLYPSS